MIRAITYYLASFIHFQSYFSIIDDKVWLFDDVIFSQWELIFFHKIEPCANEKITLVILNKGSCKFNEIFEIGCFHFFDFSKTSKSTKLGTKHPSVKEIQDSSNERSCPFPGKKIKPVKIGKGDFKNLPRMRSSKKAITCTKTFLWNEEFKFKPWLINFNSTMIKDGLLSPFRNYIISTTCGSWSHFAVATLNAEMWVNLN